MHEEEWQASVGKLSLQLLGSRAVRAAYEDQLPLKLQAALSLGCCTSVVQAARKKNLGDVFELAELQVGLAAGRERCRNSLEGGQGEGRREGHFCSARGCAR